MPDASGFIIPTILIDGQVLAGSFTLLGIDVTRSVNRIPTAMLTVQAPGSVSGETPLLAGGTFKPASDVEIKLRGNDGNDVSVFKGVVTSLGVHTRDGAPTLEVTIKDRAVRLAGARHSRIWAGGTSDSDQIFDIEAIREIVTAASLHMGDTAFSTLVHKRLVQYQATDWDFILSRAEANGLLVAVRDGSVSLAKMDPSVAAAMTLDLSVDAIADIQFELDATTQSQSLTSLVWDPAQLAATPAEAKILSLPQGGINGKSGDALGFGPAHLTHMVPLPHEEAVAWAASRMARARLALIRGRLSIPGLPDADVMQVATLAGFGDQFNGSALITGVRHRVDARGFSTDLQFGLPAEPVGCLPGIADMAAGGLLPPVDGVQLGIVVGYVDPKDMDRRGQVKVSIPAIAGDPAEFSARVALPDAGPEHGFCFLPEIGDEVLVVFLERDPRYPVVIGRLHSRYRSLPDAFTDAKQKAIISTKGVRIVFTEADKPAITISTPDGRTVTLDDDGKSIALSDKNNNKITLDANGITIASGKDLTLTAAGALKVSGRSIDLN